MVDRIVAPFAAHHPLGVKGEKLVQFAAVEISMPVLAPEIGESDQVRHGPGATTPKWWHADEPCKSPANGAIRPALIYRCSHGLLPFVASAQWRAVVCQGGAAKICYGPVLAGRIFL